MKRTQTLLSLAALLSLASCGGTPAASSNSGPQSSLEPASSKEDCPACDSCESQEPKKITYGHYTLKDSVSDVSEIEGYPWINSDIAGMLSKVEKPEAKHDFYGHANYERFEENPLPEGEDRSGGKIFESSDVTDKNIEELMKSDNANVKAILNMVKTGAKDKITADVANLLNPSTLSSALADFVTSKAIFQGRSCLATAQVDKAGKVHISYTLNTDNVNLAIVFYLSQINRNIQAYFDALVGYLEMLGYEEEDAGTLINVAMSVLVNGIVAFSRGTAEMHEVKIKDMDFDFGCIDLKAALLDMGFTGDTEVIISDRACKFLAFIGSQDDAQLAATLALSRMFDNRYCIGVENYRNLAVNHFKDLQGLKEKFIKATSTDDEVALILFKSAFTKVFDQAYIAKYVKPSTKERVDDLIEDIIVEYRSLFDQEEWLTVPTREQAKEKLDNMWHMSFYSDGFMDADKQFVVTATDPVALASDYREWYSDVSASCPWFGGFLAGGLSATTVNAMYSTADNSFAIYHGVCASYIDDENLSLEKLYGYIGMVIGHEISHGFDSTGSNFDKNGQSSDWWTAEDKAAFQAKVDAIANHYTNNIHGFHDHNYNGPKLTGEIIADMGGLNIILKLAKKQPSFNYDEFFRAVAENFAIQETRAYGIERITTDMHPEEYLRINVTLSQFEEFAETYNVKEGDGMYVAEEDRLAIW